MVSILCKNPHCSTGFFDVIFSERNRRFYCSRQCHDNHKRSLLFIYDRFWSFVDNGDNDICWPWTKSLDGSGYGQFWYRLEKKVKKRVKSSIFAYRFPWHLPGVERPTNNLCVLHACDNPICCNPAHLFLGTQQENIADMLRKKRHIFGARHPLSKITEKDVLEIRRRAACGEMYKTIAEDFPIGATSIRKISLKIRWRHV